MNTLLIAVIVVVAVAFLLAIAKGKRGSREFPYQLSKYLLSKAERSFYGVLSQAVGSTGLIFSKVRVADVISPKKGLNRSDWQRAFNAMSAKHFDFVICDPQDCSVKLAIELDDSSHSSAKGQKRDNLLNAACESARLPLLRVTAARAYVLADVRRQIEEVLSPLPESPNDNPSVEAPERVTPVAIAADTAPAPVDHSPEAPAQESIPGKVQEQGSTSPPCPKCGEPMVRRKAKSGVNAGKEFWGCGTFPKCLGAAQIDA